jgi:hypothetical protein
MPRFVEELPAKQPAVAAFLEAARGGAPLPPLYATLKFTYPARDRSGAVFELVPGQRVRVTQVGKFGDVGITVHLDEEKGYFDARMSLSEMESYSERP